MRYQGALTKWNDERGFGFISASQWPEEIFAHISAFPRDGRRPRLNELVSFETEAGPGGKLRAVRVMRPGERTAPPQSQVAGRAKRRARPRGLIFALVAIIAVCVYSYSRLVRPVPRSRPAPARPTSATTFKCDGRTRCSQMTSCEEARYFLEHCPNTQMDGDNDGEPCERQWCN